MVLEDGARVAPHAVIAATGYRSGLDAIVGHLGVVRHDGRLLVHGPYTHERGPRLYFLGFTEPLSGILREINIDAWRVAHAVAGDLSQPPPNLTRRPGPLGHRLAAQVAVRAHRAVRGFADSDDGGSRCSAARPRRARSYTTLFRFGRQGMVKRVLTRAERWAPLM